MGPITVVSAALTLVYLLMVRTKTGQRLDIDSFGAVSVFNALVGGPANVVRVVVPVLIVLIGVVLGGRALLDRRFGDASRAVVIVLGSVGLSQLLKSVILERPQLGVQGYTQNTFPSGHVALALSAAVAIAVLLPSSKWRWLTILLVGLAGAGVAWASIESYAHRPSDVIGGSLVVGVIAAAVLWGRRSILGAYPAVTFVLVGAGLLGLLLVLAGDLLQAIGFPWSAATSVPGWFLVCIVPVAGVMGTVPLSESRPANPGVS